MFASLLDSLFFYEPHLCQKRFDVSLCPVNQLFTAATFRSEPLNVALTWKRQRLPLPRAHVLPPPLTHFANWAHSPS